MRITPAPICGDCGREGVHGTVYCVRCGGNMAPINTKQYLAALLLSGLPLAIGPAAVLLIEFSGDEHGGYEGLLVIGAIVTMGAIASAYAVIGAIIGLVLMRLLNNRSLGLGVFYGLGMVAGVGATLGLASLVAVSI